MTLLIATAAIHRTISTIVSHVTTWHDCAVNNSRHMQVRKTPQWLTITAVSYLQDVALRKSTDNIKYSTCALQFGENIRLQIYHRNSSTLC
jgi:hypothetical protein